MDVCKPIEEKFAVGNNVMVGGPLASDQPQGTVRKHLETGPIFEKPDGLTFWFSWSYLAAFN